MLERLRSAPDLRAAPPQDGPAPWPLSSSTPTTCRAHCGACHKGGRRLPRRRVLCCRRTRPSFRPTARRRLEAGSSAASPRPASSRSSSSPGAKAAKFLLLGASLWSIALVRPLPFAAALIYAIFLHESGHFLAMKRRGLKTSGIWFLPFLGAVAVAKQPFRSHGETYSWPSPARSSASSPLRRCSRRRSFKRETFPAARRRGSATPRPRRSST